MPSASHGDVESRSGAAALLRALDETWQGVSLQDAGRLVVCGKARVRIGQLCAQCVRGRLVVSSGKLRCTACKREEAGRWRYADARRSLKESLAFLTAELQQTEALVRSAAEEPHAPPAWLGRPFWCQIDSASGPVRRIVWEGVCCPACERGALQYFLGPEGDCEETLACLMPGCGFRLDILARVRPEELGEVARWSAVPLEPPKEPQRLLLPRMLQALSGKTPSPGRKP